jgi:hypothetical protein
MSGYRSWSLRRRRRWRSISVDGQVLAVVGYRQIRQSPFGTRSDHLLQRFTSITGERGVNVEIAANVLGLNELRE